MSENKLTIKDRAKNRPKRVPLDQQRASKLDVHKEEGFVYRWVNEKPGRIDSFKLAGWETVSKEEAARYKQAGDASSTGSIAELVVNPTVDIDTKKAILMRIPKEFYDEDQLEKQKKIDSKELSFDPSKANKADEYGNLNVNK